MTKVYDMTKVTGILDIAIDKLTEMKDKANNTDIKRDVLNTINPDNIIYGKLSYRELDIVSHTIKAVLDIQSIKTEI